MRDGLTGSKPKPCEDYTPSDNEPLNRKRYPGRKDGKKKHMNYLLKKKKKNSLNKMDNYK